MNDLPVTRDYAALFLGDVPLMDVRAPVEFLRGAFPNAGNVPLLDDQQRQRIGIIYKERGQDAAIALGHQLATVEVRAARLSAWREFMARHPGAVLYCFRGGLRSQISQQWLAEAGIRVPRVEGGYKALRHFLQETLHAACTSMQAVVIAGRTGCGKTDLLRSLPRHLDLEGLARHRGSAFGQMVDAQPTPIDFENAVAIGLLRLRDRAPSASVLLEDESHLIGRLHLPLAMLGLIRRSPLVILEATLEERVERILRDYILAQREAFQLRFGEKGAERFAAFVLDGLDRIERRLGGERHRRIREQWLRALRALEADGCAEDFRHGIEMLLTEYYDPMYDYQLQRQDRRVLGHGDADTLRRRLADLIPVGA